MLGKSGSPLAEDVAVGFFVKADDNRLSNDERWGAQVARGAEHGGHAVGRSLPGRPKLLDLAALGHKDRGRGFRNPGGVGFPEFFGSGFGLGCLDAVGVQKLGRFDAAGSTVAVVVPIQFAGHSGSPRCPCGPCLVSSPAQSRSPPLHSEPQPRPPHRGGDQCGIGPPAPR